MKTITIKNGHVTLLFDDNETLELVPGRAYDFGDDPAQLVVRLDARRNRDFAWWAAGDLGRTALNNAPCHPVLRATVQWFIWLPPRRDYRRPVWTHWYRELPTLAHSSQEWVVQGGSGVINWAARVIAPVPDPLKERLQTLLKDIQWQWGHRQGSLEVAYYPAGRSELLPLLPSAGSSGYRSLYNHHIYPVDRWAWRVVEGVAYAVFTPPQTGETVVVSEDHEGFLTLSGGPYIYIARHPVPSNGRVD
jgi:hypothetical protein